MSGKEILILVGVLAGALLLFYGTQKILGSEKALLINYYDAEGKLLYSESETDGLKSIVNNVEDVSFITLKARVISKADKEGKAKIVSASPPLLDASLPKEEKLLPKGGETSWESLMMPVAQWENTTQQLEVCFQSSWDYGNKKRTNDKCASISMEIKPDLVLDSNVEIVSSTGTASSQPADTPGQTPDMNSAGIGMIDDFEGYPNGVYSVPSSCLLTGEVLIKANSCGYEIITEAEPPTTYEADLDEGLYEVGVVSSVREEYWSSTRTMPEACKSSPTLIINSGNSEVATKGLTRSESDSQFTIVFEGKGLTKFFVREPCADEDTRTCETCSKLWRTHSDVRLQYLRRLAAT